jgi:hypothetical protein
MLAKLSPFWIPKFHFICQALVCTLLRRDLSSARLIQAAWSRIHKCKVRSAIQFNSTSIMLHLEWCHQLPFTYVFVTQPLLPTFSGKLVAHSLAPGSEREEQSLDFPFSWQSQTTIVKSPLRQREEELLTDEQLTFVFIYYRGNTGKWAHLDVRFYFILYRVLYWIQSRIKSQWSQNRLLFRCYYGFDFYGTWGRFDRFNVYSNGECALYAAKWDRRKLPIAINGIATDFLAYTQIVDQNVTRRLAL